jgi:hypothetical protein
MEVLEFPCPNIGRVKFYGNRLNTGLDFLIKCNAIDNEVDKLVFLDSRGVGREFNGSLAEKIITRMDLKSSYIMVCRPLELTTWATLSNFMALNSIKPRKIITNMGFVDFTPKKLALLEDAIKQVDYIIGEKVAKSIFADNYVSSTGEVIKLYSMMYSQQYKQSIQNIVRSIPTVIVNTPIVDQGINIQRKRPHAFFKGLALSAAFNQSIMGAEVVNLPLFDKTLTYDAVHYTILGNEVIFNMIKEYL